MRKRVLVVDDEEAARFSMRKALKTEGYEVAVASDAKSALETESTFNPDVILTDIDMPDMDGISMLREIQRKPLPPPVIVITAFSSQELAIQSLREGALDYLTKPFELVQLRHAVRRAIERRQLTLDNIRYQNELEEKNRQLTAVEEKLRGHALNLQERVDRGTSALLETELRYRELYNQANDAIFTICCDTGMILDANLQAVKLTGYRFEELVNMNVTDLHPPEEREHILEFAKREAQIACGCGLTDDLPFLTKDGKTVILNVSCSVMEMAGIRVINRMCRDVTQIREMEAQMARYTRDLEEKFDEKKKQLLESQSQLMQAEKMAALGSLVAGVAHEINTPLGSINSSNDIFALSFKKVNEILEHLPPVDGNAANKKLPDILEIVHDTIRTNKLACERIVKIVKSLRNFARLDEAERKKADIHEGIESTLTLVAHELKRRITVIKEFGDIPEIDCFPNQLNQVFMNMLVNASQAIEGEGEIKIKTWILDGTLRIAISDNGKGIPKELHHKIFDLGFTTKRVGLGTGLGLSICYKIIQDHGGRIDIESAEGRGTTFTIVLPIGKAAERNANV